MVDTVAVFVVQCNRDSGAFLGRLHSKLGALLHPMHHGGRQREEFAVEHEVATDVVTASKLPQRFKREFITHMFGHWSW